MKKSLLAIVFAAASLPMIFAQNAAPATPNQPTSGQKSTATKKAKKTSKHSTRRPARQPASAHQHPPQK